MSCHVTWGSSVGSMQYELWVLFGLSMLATIMASRAFKNVFDATELSKLGAVVLTETIRTYINNVATLTS